LKDERNLRVSVNRVLRRILEPKKDEVTGKWRKLHSEELKELYLPNIVRVIKSRRIGWTGHEARIGDRRVHTGFWCGNLRERNHLEYPGIDCRIRLRWISNNWDWEFD
jgi:hypothetical protein